MMAGFTIVLPSPIAGNKKPTVKVGFLRDNLVGTRGLKNVGYVIDFKALNI